MNESDFGSLEHIKRHTVPYTLWLNLMETPNERHILGTAKKSRKVPRRFVALR